MKRRDPNKQLETFIADLSETQPAKRNLTVNAFEYTNTYNYRLLLKLLQVLLKRLMPSMAVDVYGIFLGSFSTAAQDRLTRFYGDGHNVTFGVEHMKLYKKWDKQRNPLNHEKPNASN